MIATTGPLLVAPLGTCGPADADKAAARSTVEVSFRPRSWSSMHPSLPHPLRNLSVKPLTQATPSPLRPGALFRTAFFGNFAATNSYDVAINSFNSRTPKVSSDSNPTH